MPCKRCFNQKQGVFYCLEAENGVYIRLKYHTEKVISEFDRMCEFLKRIPENTPYRYNEDILEKLMEMIYSEKYIGRESEAISLIGRLFDGGAI